MSADLGNDRPIPRMKPSSFLPNSSVESGGTGESTATSTTGSQQTSAYHYPTLELLRPSGAASEGVQPPDELFRLGRAIMFPALTAGSQLLKIRYLNEWQIAEKRGGGRSSSKPRGYSGYRGREVTFSTFMSDADDTTLARSTAEVIDLLRVWATMETQEAWMEQPLVALRTKWKSNISWERMQQLKKEAIGKSPEEFKSAYGQDVESGKESYFSTVPIGQPETELVQLDNPIPPMPIRFRFGNIVVAPCVIKNLEITIIRFEQNIIRSAELKFTLQEIMNNDVWGIKDTPKQKIVEARFIRTPAPNPSRGTAWYDYVLPPFVVMVNRWDDSYNATHQARW